MSKLKNYSKIIPLILVVSIFFTSCDIPDISEFTAQSAEMTRGISKGVKDTETLIKTASEREDLYSQTTREKIKKELKKYQKAIKPTLDALDGLDGYLGALNALSQASKKSEEDSKAVVNSVSGLVTAVTGFTFASEVVNVASGILDLANQFRIERSFKKRVNLASEIVEGRYIEKTEDFTINGEVKQRKILVKTCDETANDQIVSLSMNVQNIVNPILVPLDKGQKETLNALAPAAQLAKLKEWKRVNDPELNILKPLKPEEKREKLHQWGRLSDAELALINANETTINAFGCGVIDLLKFNIMDLKVINEAVSQSVYDNIQDKNETVFGLSSNINERRENIRNNLDSNSDVINLITRIDEYVAIGTAQNFVLSRKVTLKTDIDDAFIRDSMLRDALLKSLADCGDDCGKMKEVLETPVGLDCDGACVDAIKAKFRDEISPAQFNKSTAIIIKTLNVRNSELDDEDKKLKARLDLLKPDFDAASADLKAIKDKKDQLDAVLTTSLSALDAWAEAHANLRVSLNTKQPLSVSKLISKVKEIWEIIHPQES